MLTSRRGSSHRAVLPLLPVLVLASLALACSRGGGGGGAAAEDMADSSPEAGDSDADTSAPPHCETLAEGCETDGQWLCDTTSARRCALDAESGCILPGEPYSCVDDQTCTQDLCDPTYGCIHPGVACDDGDHCNGTESCDSELGCQPGKPPSCDDGLPCTGDETCDPSLGCVPGVPPVDCCFGPADCDDGDPCNGVGACDFADRRCDLAPPLRLHQRRPVQAPQPVPPLRRLRVDPSLQPLRRRQRLQWHRGLRQRARLPPRRAPRVRRRRRLHGYRDLPSRGGLPGRHRAPGVRRR